MNSLPMRWPASSLPLEVRISTEFTATETDSALNAMNSWETASPQKQFFIDDFIDNHNPISGRDNISLNSHFDNVIGIYKPDGWYGSVSNNALAITQFFAVTKTSGGQQYLEMNHADIMMNYEHFNFSTGDGITNAYDFETVVLHELGHLLGLGHISSFTADAVMNPSLAINQKKRTLRSADIDYIESNYEGFHALQAGGFAALDSSTSEIPDGTAVRGIMYQTREGICHHYIDGELVHVHAR